MSTHLWEPEHDYYGPECSYWGAPDSQAPYINNYASWREFMDGGMGNAPSGLNLLYRWDWHDWHDWHLKYPEDYEDGYVLELFWMMPRKGAMARSTITVTPADEPAVRVWLQSHWEYMRALWAPLSE